MRLLLCRGAARVTLHCTRVINTSPWRAPNCDTNRGSQSTLPGLLAARQAVGVLGGLVLQVLHCMLAAVLCLVAAVRPRQA